MAKRRSFSAEFKVRVTLEALSGVYTMAELASKYKVHANMIATDQKCFQVFAHE